MGVIVAVLVATGSIDHFHIQFWVRAAVALSLALGTAVGGGRVIRRVGVHFRPTPIDALAAEVSGAGVILAAGFLGAPVSTSETVAASVVGVGADRHPRHVRWALVAGTLSAWVRPSRPRAPGCRLLPLCQAVDVSAGSRWFLPHRPDVLALLREEAHVTLEGLEAFAQWSRHGAREAADRVRELSTAATSPAGRCSRRSSTRS